MGEIQDSLKGWRKSKGWRQEDLADKLGEPRPTYQSWETGRTPTIPPDVQGKLRKMGYKGPWPSQETQDTAPGGPAPYVTEAAFEVWRTVWREGEEKVLRKLIDLEARVKTLEGQARKTDQQGA